MSKIYVLLTKNKTVYNLKSTFLFLCIFFISSNVFGQTKWVGIGSGLGTGSDFNAPANWSTALVPTSSDDVTMNLITGATINLSSSITINKLKLFLNGNNIVAKFDVGAYALTVNDSADIDIITGDPNTELYIGVNDNTSAGTIDFKSYASFGKTPQSGTGKTSNVYINANSKSTIIFRGDLILGRLAKISSGKEFGTLIFDGTGIQNFTTNNSGKFSICSFKDVVIGSSNNPIVNLLVGTKSYVDPMLGNLTVNQSAVLNVGFSGWNGSSTGGTLALKPQSKLILSDVTGGIPGSNFPSNFSTYILDSTSTVEFNSTAAQTIPGAINRVFSYGNLTCSKGNIKTLSDKIDIFRCLTLLDNTTLALAAFDAVLKSNIVTTAYVASVPTTSNFTYGTGRFVVERFLYPQKSWRFLSVPLQKFADDPTTPTINESWREGGTVPVSTTFGTRITGPGIIAFPGGLDENTQRGSMKYYDMLSNTYKEILSSDLNSNRRIANDEGYYIFIRGDRGINVASVATGSTTLRARGKLRIGNQTYSVNKNSFQSVGNPFPSRLQFSTITKSPTMENSFTAWNPTNIGGGYGVGRFQQYIYNGSDYASIYDIKNFIESGEAFFVSNTGTGTGTITIKESDKGAGSSLYSRVGIISPTLEINLYTKATDNTDFKVDGTVLNFDPSFSNSINNDDVKKFSNASDNLYILKNNTKLFAERRPTLQINDTISLALTNTRLGPYRFNIDPSVLSNLNLKAYLQDKFLQTETPVSLSDTTDINFDITNDPNSRIADRFMIVFKKFLPVRFTAITAVRNSDKSINLTWNLENENNIDNYKIERSTDGVSFIEIGSQMPTANNFGNPYYTFYDTKASKEIIYYRIKGNGITGNSIYSNTARVLAMEENNNKPVNIFPNPVTNGNINVNFEGAVFGNYVITINNFTGQLIKSETFRHQIIGESCIIKISNAGGGFYTANIVDETGIKKMIPFLIK